MPRILTVLLILAAFLTASAKTLDPAELDKKTKEAESGKISAMTTLVEHYYGTREYSTARSWAERVLATPAAPKNEAKYACRMLGYMHLEGKGAVKNPALALSYFERGANEFDDKYAARHAVLILSDPANKQLCDSVKSWRMTERAATLGERDCALKVAQHYDGTATEYRGIAIDIPKSIDFYEIYLDNMPQVGNSRINIVYKTDPVTSYHVGILRYTGDKGVTRDYDKAFTQFLRCINATEKPENIINSGRLTDEQIGEVMWYISVCYRFGRGVSQNDLQARRWLKKAAEKGNEKAINALNNKQS